MSNNKRSPAIIRYTSRDFESIKQDLVEYAKRNYPDSYKDNSEAGFGAMMLDAVSIIGDQLSYYLDYSVNESTMETAAEYNNILKLAKFLGYKYKGVPTSQGIQTFYLIIPANTIGNAPDRNYLPILKKGSEIASLNGNGFIVNEDVDFSNINNEIVVARVDDNTGTPTAYAVKSFGQIISGKLIEELVEVGEFKKFLKLELGSANIAEIISIHDEEGNEYFEVENLTQDTIYRPIANRDATTNIYSKSILRPFLVPRRFVVERELNKTFIQFGFGGEQNSSVSQIIDPSRAILKEYGKDYISNTSFDPGKLLETDAMGIAPANTTLRVVYRVNTQSQVNASVNSVTQITNPIFEFSNISSLDANQVASVINSLETNNDETIIGDTTPITTDELKIQAYGTFSSQNRAVTLQDYKTYVYSMPGEFGSIKRVNVIQDKNSFKRNLNFYVISEDSSGKLVTTNDTIKQNLKIWLENGKMINDTIDILDAVIVNYGIEYQVIGDLNINKFNILSSCNQAIRDYLQILPEIGENFFISEIFKILNDVDGVVDVVGVKIVPKTGGVYSSATFDFEKETVSNGRFVKVPKNVVVECKYPKNDIKGSVR